MLDSLANARYGLIWPRTRLFNLNDPFSLTSLAGATVCALAYVIAHDAAGLVCGCWGRSWGPGFPSSRQT